MLNLLSSITLFLAQNAYEKKLTILGLALFAGLVFMLILDSIIKQKIVPKNDAVRGFLIFVFIVAVIAGLAYALFIK